MSRFYRSVARPILFRLDAETAHHWAIEACRLAGATPGIPWLAKRCGAGHDPRIQSTVAGLRFASPVGLAAGWDKNGQAIRMISRLGFGFAEIGSVSARPSAGNPRPRLFRIPQDRGIVVNYGLPNDGAEAVARRLDRDRTTIPIGVNLVNTNDGPNAPPADESSIIDDYRRSAEWFHHRAAYVTLNLSCPNTGDGPAPFGDAAAVGRLLQSLDEFDWNGPVFLKISPTTEPRHIESLISAALPYEFLRGFIFNLPSGKPPSLSLTTPAKTLRRMPGAVAGQPVAELINRCIAEWYRRIPADRFVLIGAGGVFTAEDAYHKIRLGASLVQIYTALIYEGPSVVRRINRGLAALLRRDGFDRVSDAVGTATAI